MSKNRAYSRLSRFIAIFYLLSGPLFADQKSIPSIPDYARKMLYYEQQLTVLDGGDPDVLEPDINRQRKKYRPDRGAKFYLTTYWVPADRMDAFVAPNLPRTIKPFLIRSRNGKAEYRLFIHPESGKFYKKLVEGCEPAGKVLAAPLASSRTLLVFPDKEGISPFLVKTSLDAVIGEVWRTIKDKEVVRSVGTNSVLNAARDELPKNFFFMPEVFGLAPKTQERGGMIVRTIPGAIRSGQQEFIPLFSLYATPPDKSRPILVEMIEQSRQTASEFIRTRLIRPFVKQWLDLTVDYGISMEPHAQNLLAGIGRDGLLNGTFLHRDFGGFNIDLRYRRERGLVVPDDLPAIHSVYTDYYQAYHRPTLEESFSTYFVSGVLYDIDQRLSIWMKRNWIPKEKLSAGTTSDMAYNELVDYYEKKTGIRKRLNREDPHLERWVIQARKQLKCGVTLRKIYTRRQSSSALTGS